MHDSSGKGCPHSISRDLTYDGDGNVTRETRCILGKALTITTAFDPLDRITRITYPDKERVRLLYDHQGNLASIPGYVTDLQYDPQGRLGHATYANGTTTTWTYAPLRSWLTRETVQRGRQTLFDATYSHLANGLVASTRSPTNKMNFDFRYDAVDRLISSTGDWNQALHYDDTGNITYNSRLGAYDYGSATHHGSNTSEGSAGRHAVTSAGNQAYFYHAAGETTKVTQHGRAIRKLRWNADGLPTVIIDKGHATTIMYDGTGVSVQQTTAEHHRLFGSLYPMVGEDGLVKYIYAAGMLVARRANRLTQWYTTDPSGSPRLMTDAAGKTIARLDYTPFGVTFSGGDGQPIGYGGHRRAGATDLIDMNARLYEAALGRRTTRHDHPRAHQHRGAQP